MTFCQQQHTADLNEVCGWLGVACPDDIRTEFVTRPTADFISQIKEMLNTYDEFPEDARRTQRIINAIRSGKPAQPVYIEQGDHDLFIMEGRHRIVAFYLLGITEVTVCYCHSDAGKHG